VTFPSGPTIVNATTPEPVALTVRGVLEHMAAAVNEVGADHKYEEPEDVGHPVYVYGDCASCLCGVVLHRCGVPLERMWVWNSDDIDELLDHLVAEGVVTLEEGVRPVLLTAQERQDYGYTWGQALAAAQEVAARIGVGS
jgi:hypothetical protein